jgi:hypothetical protein
MKRLTTLALIVFALAAVPAALGDDATLAAPSAPAAQQQRHVAPGMRLEILRLRMQIVQLRFRLHCSGGRNADKCQAFAQRVDDRLTKLDGNVQSKLAELKACTTSSTDGKCRNAEKKIAMLTKLDEHLQNAIQKVEDWLAGKTTATDPSSDSALDQAASQLASGSNG